MARKTSQEDLLCWSQIVQSGITQLEGQFAGRPWLLREVRLLCSMLLAPGMPLEAVEIPPTSPIDRVTHLTCDLSAKYSYVSSFARTILTSFFRVFSFEF